MIHSMTAYATTQGPLDAANHAVWEIKSVNHRFLDLTFRLPEGWRQIENELRQQLARRVVRGKVEVRLQVTTQFSAHPTWDEAALTALANWQRQLRERFPDAAPLSIGEILRLLGIVPQNDADTNGAVRQRLLELFAQALDQLCAHRQREGEQLAAGLRERAHQIAHLVDAARQLAPEAQRRYTAQLQAAVAAIETPDSAERIRLEVALFAQKVDITEELDRLAAHLVELNHTLSKEQGPVGKRLDFLMQEFHREANTLAAKAALPELTKIALEMKVVIEQMREQVQNLE